MSPRTSTGRTTWDTASWHVRCALDFLRGYWRTDLLAVGRWQKNKKLGWYASADNPDPSASEQEMARKKEIAAIKLAEQEALAAALGFPITGPAVGDAPQVSGADVARAVKEVAPGEELEGEGGDGDKGVGFGAFAGPSTSLHGNDEGREVLQGFAESRSRGGLGGEERKRSERHRRRSRSRERSPAVRHRRDRDTRHYDRDSDRRATDGHRHRRDRSAERRDVYNDDRTRERRRHRRRSDSRERYNRDQRHSESSGPRHQRGYRPRSTSAERNPRGHGKRTRSPSPHDESGDWGHRSRDRGGHSYRERDPDRDGARVRGDARDGRHRERY